MEENVQIWMNIIFQSFTLTIRAIECLLVTNYFRFRQFVSYNLTPDPTSYQTCVKPSHPTSNSTYHSALKYTKHSRWWKIYVYKKEFAYKVISHIMAYVNECCVFKFIKVWQWRHLYLWTMHWPHANSIMNKFSMLYFL